MEEKIRSEADTHFGTCLELVSRFKSTGPPRPELPTMRDREVEVETKWRDYENWAKSWKQFVQARLDWEQERTAAVLAELPDPQCNQCHGTGVVLRDLEARKLEYWTLHWKADKWDYWAPMWGEDTLIDTWRQALQSRPHLAAEFSQDTARLQEIASLSDYNDEWGVTGRIMRYLAAHEKASIPYAVLTSDGTWHE